MFDLDAILRSAQGGEAAANLARGFGVPVENTLRAFETLAPAYALGMRRSASSPELVGALLAPLARGDYASYYDGRASLEAARAAGDQVMRLAFGTTSAPGAELTRAIAAQAARASGLSPEVVAGMMPAVGAILMGGLFCAVSDQGLAPLFEAMARTTSSPAFPPKPSDPISAYSEMMTQFWGGLLGAPKPPATMQSGLDSLADLFDVGRKLQGQQLEGLAAMFEAFARSTRD